MGNFEGLEPVVTKGIDSLVSDMIKREQKWKENGGQNGRKKPKRIAN